MTKIDFYTCTSCGTRVDKNDCDYDTDLDLCVDCSIKYCTDNNVSGSFVEKFECEDCGIYYWVEDRDDFDCPNCEDCSI